MGKEGYRNYFVSGTAHTRNDNVIFLIEFITYAKDRTEAFFKTKEVYGSSFKCINIKPFSEILYNIDNRQSITKSDNNLIMLKVIPC
jgi:hypothetical protein